MVEKEVFVAKIFKKRETLLLTRLICKQCKKVSDQEIIGASNTLSYLILNLKCQNTACNHEAKLSLALN
jgi:hypothetical protein